MRVLLDECVPHDLKRRLQGFSVATVQDKGWTGIKNGELLRRAAAEFDVLVTSDKRLRHQQSFAGMPLALVVLPTNRVPDVLAVVPQLEAALRTARPGEVTEIPPA